MEDLITVIVPIYNRENFVADTIESIINQTHKNLEIILVDDGSSDNTLSIIKHYQRLDNRIKIFIQKNMGICMAVKNALKISNGKYIARCDSDDINELNRYERQLKYLKENDYDMVGAYVKSFGNGSEVAKAGMEIFSNRAVRDRSEQLSRIYNGGTIGGGLMLAKADVLREFDPFHEDYGLVEDVYLYITLIKNNCRIGIMEEVLYNYRVHDSNTSLSNNRKNVVDKYFEVIFRFLFNDVLYKYKNIVIIKREQELNLIRNSLNKYFGNLNFNFVSEIDFDNFLKMEILNYKSEHTIFFVGGMFFKYLDEILKHRNYKLYENLFMLVDCFWNG